MAPANSFERTRGGEVDVAATALAVALRDTFDGFREWRADGFAAGRALFRDTDFAAFAFKRTDLTAPDRFAAFFVGLDFVLPLVAMSHRNCKWLGGEKSRQARGRDVRRPVPESGDELAY